MFNYFKKFIKGLQNSNEKTKKRWLWIFSASAVSIVVALWGVYINSVIIGVGFEKTSLVKKEVIKESIASVSDSNVAGFSKIFKNGLKMVAREARFLSNKLRAKFGEANLSRIFIIRQIKLDFTLDNLEKIPPRELP